MKTLGVAARAKSHIQSLGNTFVRVDLFFAKRMAMKEMTPITRNMSACGGGQIKQV